VPRFWLPTDAMAVLQIHQSAINNGLDRFDLAGKTLDREGIGQLFREKLGSLMPEKTGTEEEPAKEGDSGGITFADKDPIRVHFEDGLIAVTLRATRFRSGDVDVSGQIITPRFRPEVGDGVVTYVRDGVIEVRPMEEPKTDIERFQALGLAATITGALQAILPEKIETKGTVALKGGDDQDRTFAVVKMKVLDGWITVVVR
jgi:hypothetical protein